MQVAKSCSDRYSKEGIWSTTHRRHREQDTWCSVIRALTRSIFWGIGSWSRWIRVVSAHWIQAKSSSRSSALATSSDRAASRRCWCCFAHVRTCRERKKTWPLSEKHIFLFQSRLIIQLLLRGGTNLRNQEIPLWLQLRKFKLRGRKRSHFCQSKPNTFYSAQTSQEGRKQNVRCLQKLVTSTSLYQPLKGPSSDRLTATPTHLLKASSDDGDPVFDGCDAIRMADSQDNFSHRHRCVHIHPLFFYFLHEFLHKHEANPKTWQIYLSVPSMSLY